MKRASDVASDQATKRVCCEEEGVLSLTSSTAQMKHAAEEVLLHQAVQQHPSDEIDPLGEILIGDAFPELLTHHIAPYVPHPHLAYMAPYELFRCVDWSGLATRLCLAFLTRRNHATFWPVVHPLLLVLVRALRKCDPRPISDIQGRILVVLGLDANIFNMSISADTEMLFRGDVDSFSRQTVGVDFETLLDSSFGLHNVPRLDDGFVLALRYGNETVVNHMVRYLRRYVCIMDLYAFQYATVRFATPGLVRMWHDLPDSLNSGLVHTLFTFASFPTLKEAKPLFLRAGLISVEKLHNIASTHSDPRIVKLLQCDEDV
jgi:hypothetical protein